MKVIRQTTASGNHSPTTILENFDAETTSISYSEDDRIFEIQTIDDKGRDYTIQVSVAEFASMFGHLSPSLIESGLADSNTTSSIYKMLRKYSKQHNNGE